MNTYGRRIARTPRNAGAAVVAMVTSAVVVLSAMATLTPVMALGARDKLAGKLRRDDDFDDPPPPGASEMSESDEPEPSGSRLDSLRALLGRSKNEPRRAHEDPAEIKRAAAAALQALDQDDRERFAKAALKLLEDDRELDDAKFTPPAAIGLRVDLARSEALKRKKDSAR